MKASFYNTFFRENDSMIGYNCMSLIMVKMSMDDYNLFERICSGESIIELKPEEVAVIEELKKQRFLIDDDVNELDIIKAEHYCKRFNPDILNLTIAPTLNCNFNCKYCFEGEKPKEYMSKETESNIIRYVESRAPVLRSIRVLWFGGEPTLALDQVFNISKGIMRIAEEYKIEFVAAMLTNGYLLTRDVAFKLRDHNVKSVTLTLDGPPGAHDARRPLKSGKGTFETIFNNIKEIIDIIGVHVQCIIDKDNADEVAELINIFKDSGLSKRICLSPRPAQPYTSACMSVSHTAFNVKEFSELIKKYYPLFLEGGFNVKHFDPYTKADCCGGIGNTAIAIAPNGDIHYCNETINNTKERIGNIAEPVKMSSNVLKWLTWDPFEIEECKNCKTLPLCLGGCPYLTIVKDTGVSFENRCYAWKYNLEEILKIIYAKSKGVEV